MQLFTTVILAHQIFGFLKFSKAQDSSSTSYIQSFLDQNPTSISVCNMAVSDQIYEEIFQMSTKANIWTYFWNCLVSEIPQGQGGLIILNDITPNELQKVFSKSHIQNSITYNIWVIYISSKDTYSLFEEIKLKIGINAQIFIVKYSGVMNEVIQVIGTGLNQVEFKVCSILLNILKLEFSMPQLIKIIISGIGTNKECQDWYCFGGSSKQERFWRHFIQSKFCY